VNLGTDAGVNFRLWAGLSEGSAGKGLLGRPMLRTVATTAFGPVCRKGQRRSVERVGPAQVCRKGQLGRVSLSEGHLSGVTS